jgi:hypothetical protein
MIKKDNLHAEFLEIKYTGISKIPDENIFFYENETDVECSILAAIKSKVNHVILFGFLTRKCLLNSYLIELRRS